MQTLLQTAHRQRFEAGTVAAKFFKSDMGAVHRKTSLSAQIRSGTITATLIALCPQAYHALRS